METLKENLCINQTIGRAKENITAEEDVIIPDIKPDILSVVNTSGLVCIYKREILEGKIKIEGGIQTYIMYLADDENASVRGINTVIDFSKTIEIENANPGMTIDCNVSLKDIECKILNGRKVNLAANLEVDVNISSNENIEFIKGIENMDDVQMLNSSCQMDSLLGSGSTRVYAKDTINIDKNDNFAEILKMNADLINKEIKTSYNKVLAKGDMHINIVYLTEDNRVNQIDCNIPVMGFIDMPDISDDNLCSVTYQIKNIIVKPNSTEEHSIYVEVEIEIFCNVYQKKQINIIQDLYSPSQKLDINQKNVVIMQDKQLLKNECNVEEKLNIPEMQNCKIINAEATPRIINQKVYNGKVSYEGELEIKFIYISNNANRVDIKNQIVPFNKNIECPINSSKLSVNTNIEISTQEFNYMEDGSVVARIGIGINTDVSKMDEIKVIDNIKPADADDDNIYSIVVYFVKPGDTLWNIAKKFRSTANVIASVNGIEDENKINVGQQLFIPKFV